MFDRENIVGSLLLLLCGVVASILVYSIVTGERLDFDLPPVVSTVLGFGFIALLIVGFLRSGIVRRLRGGQGGQQWPNPATGQRSLWDRLRGR